MAIGFIVLAGFSGCSALGTKTSGPTCPKCPLPSNWSTCNEELEKNRTNYACGADTNYTCQNYEEKQKCKTELTQKSRKGLQSRISPTLENTVKGIITVEAFDVPEGTDSVAFIMHPAEVTLGPNMSAADLAKIIRHDDGDEGDGWKSFFDTTKLKNGLYEMNIFPTYSGAPDEDPWLDKTSFQIFVEN